MSDTQPSAMVEVLLESLETMAFVTLLPSEDPHIAPPDARLITINFTRPGPGSIKLVAPLALGRIISANLMGVEPDAPEVATGAEDALRELINITCGALLMKNASTSAEPFQMGIPTVEPFDTERDWETFIAQNSATVLDADGCPIAVQLQDSK